MQKPNKISKCNYKNRVKSHIGRTWEVPQKTERLPSIKTELAALNKSLYLNIVPISILLNFIISSFKRVFVSNSFIRSLGKHMLPFLLTKLFFCI